MSDSENIIDITTGKPRGNPGEIAAGASDGTISRAELEAKLAADGDRIAPRASAAAGTAKDEAVNQRMSQIREKSRRFNEELDERLAANRSTSPSSKIGMRERISDMSLKERGWTVANTILAGLFLHGAIHNFKNTVNKDAEGKNHVQWSQATWGAVQGLLSVLCAAQVFESLRGGGGITR